MTVQNEKFRNFNTERKATTKAVSDAVSKLNKELAVAIKQQAYMRSNPDDNGANELITIVSDEIDAIAISLSNANSKATDLLAVKAGTMTVEQLLAKYTAINLTEYSEELL
jgi:hypothetical protein